ncbi:MAG: hypothetical protein PWP28_533 [Oceanotoga sp.]|nr:hypothetical protein [Oceanotoga sp.]
MKKALSTTSKKITKFEKKQFIAETALEVIVEKGLNNFTMDDVAKKAALSKGSLYNYFKNKNSLIIFAFGDLVKKFENTVESKLYEEKNTLEDKAELISEMYFSLHSEFASDELMRLFEILINSYHDNEMIKQLTEIFSNYYNKMLSKLEGIVNSKTKALMIHAMFDGLTMYKAVGVNVPQEKFKEEFKDILIKLSV